MSQIIKPLASVTRWAGLLWEGSAHREDRFEVVAALLGHIHKESGGGLEVADNARVTGAYGLLQHLLRYWSAAEVADPRWHLRHKLDSLDRLQRAEGYDLPTALLALATGPTNLRRWIEGHQIEATERHALYFASLYRDWEVYAGWLAGWLAAGQPTVPEVITHPARALSWRHRGMDPNAPDLVAQLPKVTFSMDAPVHEHGVRPSPGQIPHHTFNGHFGSRAAPTPPPREHVGHPPVYQGQHDPRRPTLRRGAQGQHVLALQRALNAAGARPRLTEDGDFGPATDRALTAFQRAHRLAADGVAGRKTWAAIDRFMRGIKPSPEAGGEVEPQPSEKLEASPAPQTKPSKASPKKTAKTLERTQVGEESGVWVGGSVVSVDGVMVRRGQRFKVKARRKVGAGKAVDTVVLHTNAGPGNPSSYFAGEGLGVHLFIELDGVVWTGNDLDEALAHAGALNARSVAVELRNSGRLHGPDDRVWAHKLQTQAMRAKWAWGRWYCLPTRPQGDALVAIFRALSDALGELAIEVPTPDPHDKRPHHKARGWVAHHTHSTHGDGLPELAYLHARLQGLDHLDACQEVARRYSDDGQLHDLDDIIPDRPARPLGPKGAPDSMRYPWETP